MAAAPPPNSGLPLSIGGDNRWDEKNEVEEEKCGFLVVALCPCLDYGVRFSVFVPFFPEKEDGSGLWTGLLKEMETNGYPHDGKTKL